MSNLADKLSKNPPSEAVKNEADKPPEANNPLEMKKHLTKKKRPNFFRMKGVLGLVCVLSILAALTTVVLFSRHVFDCVEAEESVHITVNNTLSGKVHYAGGQTPIFEKIGGFFLNNTDAISLTLDTKAGFSKPIKASYTVSMKTELVIMHNGASLVVDYKEYEPVVLLNQARGSTQEIVDGTGPVSIELSDVLSDIAVFNGNHPGWSSAEIIVTFITKYKNDTTNKIVTNMSTGVTIRLSKTAFSSSDPYTFIKTGATTAQSDFPPREIKMPTLAEIVGVTLLLGGLVAAFALSIIGLRTDQDPYKRAIKGILRKFGDEVAVAQYTEFPKGTTKVTVDNFKELLKFSQHLSKPITFAEKEPGSLGLFYILCDNMVYRYEVRG